MKAVTRVVTCTRGLRKQSMTVCVHMGAREAFPDAGPPNPKPLAAVEGGVHTTLRCQIGRSNLLREGGYGRSVVRRGNGQVE